MINSVSQISPLTSFGRNDLGGIYEFSILNPYTWNFAWGIFRLGFFGEIVRASEKIGDKKDGL